VAKAFSFFSSLFAQPQSAHHLPLPLSQIRWLAIDLELTGLNVHSDEIVSVGWLQGKGQTIDMASGYHAYIKTQAELNQSPVIHGITQTDIEDGADLSEQLQKLSEYQHSHVWVFHHHVLDWSILKRHYQQLDLPLPTPLIVDTILLERYLTSKGGAYHQRVDLSSARARHKLPPALAHNALDDAWATLELLFAQLTQLGVTSTSPLKALKHTGAVV